VLPGRVVLYIGTGGEKGAWCNVVGGGGPRVNEGVGEELFDCHIVTGDLSGNFASNGLGYTTIH
jgi:hypothetical protein